MLYITIFHYRITIIKTQKPFADSCEQNKHAILGIIEHEFQDSELILEIGSGTGQHAVFFAEHLPHLTWQTSEQAENLLGIRQWINDSPCNNILEPINLNVSAQWPNIAYSGIFSANTVHIMSWPEVEVMFDGIGKILKTNSPFCLYGPFNYGNNYTSESNENFDTWLKNRDPNSAIRNFEDLVLLAERHGLLLKDDHEMPANNRILVWIKK